MIRANNANTAAGTPAGKAVSIGRAPSSPSGTPLTFGTDLTFQTSILTGDNTHTINGLYNHNEQIWVAKDDFLYNVTGTIPTKYKYGADAAPSTRNGIAAVTGADGLFYIASFHDVMFISGSSAYPTNLPFNLPSNRAGDVYDLTSKLGWVFAALDASKSGWSSVMRMNTSDRSWHEQIRGFDLGRRIRTVEWLEFEDVRPQLVWECAGELLYQQFPLYGVRPQQDSGLAYQPEGEIEFATMDLLNTNPKYFSFFTGSTKNLANAANASAYGREIAVDYQLNDNIGGATWLNAGAFGLSPKDKVSVRKGSQTKLRARVRICSNQSNNPPVLENFALSMFQREPTFNSFLLDIDAENDEELSGGDLYDALVDLVFTADVVETESIFEFLDKKQVLLSVQPNIAITGLDVETGMSAKLQLYLEYVPE